MHKKFDLTLDHSGIRKYYLIVTTRNSASWLPAVAGDIDDWNVYANFSQKSCWFFRSYACCSRACWCWAAINSETTSLISFAMLSRCYAKYWWMVKKDFSTIAGIQYFTVNDKTSVWEEDKSISLKKFGKIKPLVVRGGDHNAPNSEGITPLNKCIANYELNFW